MEGLAWLLIKMAVLLALTGVSFLALGWWLRGRQIPVSEEHPDQEIEQIRTALRAAESSRDSIMSELASVRSQLAVVEDEVRQLRAAPVPASPPEATADDFILQSPAVKKSKPKAPRKPRAKKSKG